MTDPRSFHVVVIGGGFAGAAAASALAEAGAAVTLLEQGAVLGGRARSWRPPEGREDLEDIPPLLAAGFRETRRFLRRLQIEDRVVFSKSLAPTVLCRGGVHFPLRLRGVWALAPGLGLADRARLWRAVLALRLSKRDLTAMTAARWLSGARVSVAARRAFWEPLCRLGLGADLEDASAQALKLLVRGGFSGKARDRVLGQSKVGFGKLWPVEFAVYLKNRGGALALRQKVAGLEVADGRVRRVLLDGGEAGETDGVVSAVPLRAFLKICPPQARGPYHSLEKVPPSRRITVHLWIKDPPLRGALTLLLDPDALWVHRPGRVPGQSGPVERVAVGMAPAALPAGSPDEDWAAKAQAALRRSFPDMAPSERFIVSRDDAGVLPTPAFWRVRPGPATPLPNLCLAGDWTDTGLPPGLESACASGHLAARTLLSALRRAEQPAAAVG